MKITGRQIFAVLMAIQVMEEMVEKASKDGEITLGEAVDILKKGVDASGLGDLVLIKAKH